MAWQRQVAFTSPAHAVYVLSGRSWKIVSRKQAAIDTIKSQPFFKKSRRKDEHT